MGLTQKSYSFRTTGIMELITSWIDSYGERAVLLIPVLAFAEACVGLGIFVSGALLLLLSSYLYSNGVIAPEWIMMLAMIGAVIGDHAGFYFGYLIGPGIHHSRWAMRYQDRLQKAEAMIRRFGGFAIFVGRFVPAIRSIIPALLGVSGYKRRLYSLLDIGACILWSAALVLIVMGIDLAL